MDNCIFCRIVKGEVPSYKVWEDEKHLAFLNIHPMKEGHVLVIPRKHFSYLFDMPDPDYAQLMSAVKAVSHLIKESFKPESDKVGMIVYGLDVDHVHVHLAPLDERGELSLANSKPASDEQLRGVLHKFRRNLPFDMPS